MLDDFEVLLALRRHLLSVTVVGTGVTTLGATGTAFTRAAGSFIDDGFVPGMEVVPAGFANNDPEVVRSVSALQLGIEGSRPPESQAAGRSLTVGIPVIRGWENIAYEPRDDLWTIEEDYLPGPTAKVTMPNEGGQLEHIPTYVLRLSGLSGRGVNAMYKVATAILTAFKPGSALPLPDGNVVRVRTFPAPYRGQLMQDEAGKASIALTFPLLVRTINP